MSNNMQGKTLVISGGTKGIGKECVYKFVVMVYQCCILHTTLMVKLLKRFVKMLNLNLELNVNPFNILEPEKYSELFDEIDKKILIELISLFQMQYDLWKSCCWWIW